MTKPHCLGALLLLALVSACGRVDRIGTEGSGASVRDSAGVRIVENQDAPTGRWRVGAEPLFTVGWAADGPAFMWPQSGRILQDGGALVGEFGEGAIYRLASDGSVMETWGRKGEGPGEYQELNGLVMRGDSVVVSDGRLRRITVLSLRGDVWATRPLAGTFFHQGSALLRDGRLLLVPGEGYGGGGGLRPEWVFETQPILAADLEAGTADTLAELPHLRRWYGARGGRPGPVQVKGRAGGFAEGFAWSRSDEREVRWYDGSGRLVQLARWQQEPVPLTPEWRRRMARFYEEAYRSIGAEESFVAAQLVELEEGMDRHDGPLPYWDSFHVDRLGSAWLSEYDLPGEAPPAWRVLTRDGTLVGRVELPDVIAILDITDDRVLAVRLDDLDVPAVVMLELIKE